MTSRSVEMPSHGGANREVMVEGKNEARAQWIGRTSQNKTLNFTAPPDVTCRLWAATSKCASAPAFPTVF